jgi:putative hydrolase of the HAD superfamily
MTAPRAIFFDLDDTLADGSGLPGAIRASCDELAAMTGSDASELRRANGEAWQKYWPSAEAHWTLGHLSGDALSIEVWRRTLLACDLDVSLAPRARAIHVRHALAAVRLFDDARDLLDRIGRESLVLITNGASDTQRGTLRVLGIEDRFTAIIVSGEIGIAKPDPSVFRMALDAASARPEEAWHIGDSLTTDVAGAIGAGLTAVWLNRRKIERGPDDPMPHHEISSLSQLADLIGLT